MLTQITQTEARILGSLVEKQLTTPEYYPLTLNALTAACNQKSNREPVMSLGETELLAAIDELRDKNLVYLYYGSTSRTVKYKHMLPNVYELDDAETAIIALLLLRGPQTAGEVRGRADRLHEFGGIGEVQQTLDALARRDDPLIAALPKQPGQKEPRYTHMLFDDIDLDTLAASAPRVNADTGLTKRIDKLEAALAELSTEFAEFRKQFE